MPDIRCIIIEDEPLAARVLSEYVAELPYLQLTGIFKDALLAAESLHRQTVDLIFLDIHLPRLMGLDFLRTLPVQPAVIVTTAHHEYAVEFYFPECTEKKGENPVFRYFIHRKPARVCARSVPPTGIPVENEHP
jgi:two-component system, LytTR family, response regulator